MIGVGDGNVSCDPGIHICCAFLATPAMAKDRNVLSEAARAVDGGRAVQVLVPQAELASNDTTDVVAGNTADVVTVRISLRSTWFTTMAMNKAASVVFHVASERGGRQERNYRGDTTALNWAGTQSEFNDMLNLTFAEALDAMAKDLRPLCGGA